MELSMKYGGGNLRWFSELPHDQQVDVLAAHVARGEVRSTGGGLSASGKTRATTDGARFWLGGGE